MYLRQGRSLPPTSPERNEKLDRDSCQLSRDFTCKRRLISIRHIHRQLSTFDESIVPDRGDLIPASPDFATLSPANAKQPTRRCLLGHVELFQPVQPIAPRRSAGSGEAVSNLQ